MESLAFEKVASVPGFHSILFASIVSNKRWGWKEVETLEVRTNGKLDSRGKNGQKMDCIA